MWKGVLKAINRRHKARDPLNESELSARFPNGSVIYLVGAPLSFRKGLDRDTPSPSIDLTAFTGPRCPARIRLPEAARETSCFRQILRFPNARHVITPALWAKIRLVERGKGIDNGSSSAFCLGGGSQRKESRSNASIHQPHHLRVMGLGTHHDRC